MTNKQRYVVGGAVRDTLLGLEPKDVDYVYVGYTPDDMVSLGLNFIPANSFPVFLDENGDEHALARTEHKTGTGYHGFTVDYNPNVTIEEDLFRRDITTNSMCVPIEHWEEFKTTLNPALVIDPFNGLRDLQNSTLRHTSEHFADDPVRFLRICRFAARYGFAIADSTSIFMHHMANNGELDHLTPERVWLELDKALFELRPLRFFAEIQYHLGWNAIFPSLKDLDPAIKAHMTIKPNPIMQVLHKKQYRFAEWCKLLTVDQINALCNDIKAPNDFKESALLVSDFYHSILSVEDSLYDFTILKTFLNHHNCLRNPDKLWPLTRILSIDKHDIASQWIYHFVENINSVKFEHIPEDVRLTLKGKQINEFLDGMQRVVIQQFRDAIWNH